MLTPDEIESIEAGIQQLTVSAAGGSYKVIRAGIERLDKATRRFAELMMDTEVMGAMKGQTMTEAGEGMGEGPSAPHPFAKAEFDEPEKEK
jgi:molecular chaperone DnaK/molecular chaperone HscA